MTTPPHDPYALPSSAPGTSGMRSQAPPPPMPGAFPPPVGGFPQADWAPSKPSGLARWAIITTGAFVLSFLGMAMMIDSIIEMLKSSFDDNAPLIQFNPFEVLMYLAMPASYVVLAMWMMAIRNNLKKRGIVAGGPPAVEWWGWFVPAANVILPFLGMQAIARRTVPVGLLLGWWIPFCVFWIGWYGSSFVTSEGMDWVTMEITNAAALDGLAPYYWVMAIASLISWVFLVTIIRNVTDKHLTAN